MLIRMLRVWDQIVLAATVFAIIYFRPELEGQAGAYLSQANYHASDAAGVFLLAVGWIAIFDYCVHYKSDRFVGIRAQLKDAVKASVLASFWLMLVSSVFSIRSITVVNIPLFWAITTVICVASRVLLRRLLVSARRSGYNYRFLLVVGDNAWARDTGARIEARPEMGFKIVGFVSETPLSEDPEERPSRTLGELKELQAILQRERVDEVMICLPLETRFGDFGSVVQHARDLGIVVRILPHLQDGSLLREFHLEEFDGQQVVTLFREQMLFQLLGKRLLDLVVSAVALLFLSVPLLVVALIIKLTSKGPVFFKQTRVGMNQRQFVLYKFRSMVVDAEARKAELQHLNERDGPAFKIVNDPRITPSAGLSGKPASTNFPSF